MGKKKGKGGKQPRKSSDVYVESNEYHDGLEHDEKDAYEAQQDDIMMNKLSAIQSRNKRRDVSGGIDEMYALSGDSDSSDDEDGQAEFMETRDDEDTDEVRAWGKKKKHFYGGNPNDNRHEELADDELNEAEAEEAESKLLQKKQLENLDDEDFFEAFTTPNESTANVLNTPKIDDNVAFDLDKLSKKERVSLFHRQAPEFKGLLRDFELKMTEVIEKLQPAISLAEEGKIPDSGPAMDFVRSKFKLLLT